MIDIFCEFSWKFAARISQNFYHESILLCVLNTVMDPMPPKFKYCKQKEIAPKEYWDDTGTSCIHLAKFLWGRHVAMVFCHVGRTVSRAHLLSYCKLKAYQVTMAGTKPGIFTLSATGNHFVCTWLAEGVDLGPHLVRNTAQGTFDYFRFLHDPW